MGHKEKPPVLNSYHDTPRLEEMDSRINAQQVNKRGDEADSATVVTDGLGGSSNFGGSSGSAKSGEVVLPRRRRRR